MPHEDTRRLSLGLVLLMAACAPQGDRTDDATCVDDADHFAAEVYPGTVQEVCMACHTADGVAKASDLVFVTKARPDHVAANQQVLTTVATLERDGQSIVLRKPLGLDDHGGGKVLSEDEPAFVALQAFVDRLDTPVVCDDDAGDVPTEVKLSLLTPVETLRKASLLLAGKLPSAEATDRVRAGGEGALISEVWAVMDSPTFEDVFLERLNDVFHTDRYLNGNDAIGIVDEDTFPGVYWYENMDSSGERNAVRDRIAEAVAREPLMLATHVMRNDLPWTEILTADYTMVNGFTALAYDAPGAKAPDLDDPDARHRFVPAQLEGVPHAGMLTTPAFLNRYPTTPTNRNRHRAWFFYKTFLATDILTFADRPIDPTVSSVHNPTLNDAQCTVCHATMDPVAGAFQNWDDEGRYRPPEEGWYGEMASPGFRDDQMPSSDKPQALSWLAAQAVQDVRFDVASVRMMLEAFTGLDPLTTLTAGDDPVKVEALALQDAFIEDVASEFRLRGHDIRYVVERVVTSRYFRAKADDGATDGALLQAGTARMLTPEELNRKIVATLGLPWKSRRNSSDTLLGDRYRMLYGGIDSFGLTERLRDPNGIIGAIGLRMATELACDAVTADFLLDPAQRRLLPDVERSFEPVTDDGFEVPGAREAIVANIQHLHHRLLGETLSADHPEIQASWELWRDTWQAGRDGLRAGEIDDSLPDGCRVRHDPWTGDDLPGSRRIESDPTFTVRAWVAVTSYLLADWRFLHE